MSLNISKIIHQIGPKDKKDWHPIWEDCHRSWKKQFPETEYKHILWNDEEDLSSLIENYYPDYLNFYNSLPFHIMKIDFARICILNTYGGIYADLDFYCYKNFYNSLEEDFYIIESWEEWGEKIQNSLIVSTKNNEFLKQVIYSCLEKFNNTNYNEDVDDYCEYILNVTGPKLISSVSTSNIKILPKEIFNPQIENQFNWAKGNYTSDEYKNAYTDFLKLNNNEDKVITRHYLTGCW